MRVIGLSGHAVDTVLRLVVGPLFLPRRAC